ncbi:MAG TPA: YggT family protein [Mycobacteriales bacterium]|nr:YggT family protein [Mycobacteriales bacterium]
MIAAIIGIYVLWVLVGLLFVRLVMDYVMMFARSYRPTGLVAAALELAYSATDPPLKALRRVIPPLRLGRVSLDLSFMVLFFAAYALIVILSPYT